MYPNPQDALPLPVRPSLERYKKLAKDLVKSCKSDDPAAIRTWAIRWIQALAALQPEPGALWDEKEITSRADQVEQFARKKMSGDRSSLKCALAGAQLVIARA